MATSTLPAPTAGIPTRGSRIPRLSFTRPNIIGGLGGWLWLAIIIIPLYYVVVTSLKDQTSYFTENPLALPSSPTLDNYRLVLQNDFVRYFVNSVIVTIGTVLPVLVICFMASYAIVRGHGRLLRLTNSMFLLGLAIPRAGRHHPDLLHDHQDPHVRHPRARSSSRPSPSPSPSRCSS